MLPSSSAVEPHHIDRTASDGHSALVTRLAADGIALIDGVHDQPRLLDLARSLGSITPHRDSAADGVTTIANLGKVGHQSGFAGFSTDALNPHTDRSGVPNPPTLLLMACRQPAATGGECIAIDGQAVYADLAEAEPEALHALSQPRSALFGGAAGHLGAVFERTADGLDLEDEWRIDAIEGWILDARVELLQAGVAPPELSTDGEATLIKRANEREAELRAARRRNSTEATK